MGFILVLVGLLFFLAARLMLRTAPRLRPTKDPSVFSEQIAKETNRDAIMLVLPGGRLYSMNPQARAAFNLQDGENPDLERLARRTRPSNEFIELCAAESWARFALDGRMVEGNSYRLTLTDQPMMMVSLHFLELAAELNGPESSANLQTVQTITELTQAMAASLDLNQTLRAVLENIGKLVPADFMELTVWNNETRQLIPFQYHWVTGSERRLEKPDLHYSTEEGYSGYLYRERYPLLIPDVDQRFDVRPLEGHTPGLRAYLGVPLMAGKVFVGTIELGSRTPETFRGEDLELVKLVSGQAAITIHNAIQYNEEQKKSTELAGLAQLAQAFSSAKDVKSLFTCLVSSISPLVHVEILGFLLYNEMQRRLEGQIPYHGLPDQIMELYKAEVLPNSLLEQTLLDQDLLISEDAANDAQWVTLGLDHMARAASLRDTVLVPLNSGGGMLGYLQASNHPGGETFTQSELHLLMIIANQTASIIENVHLVQRSQERIQRAEALRQITSLTNSAANLDEILQFSIREMGRLLHADTGAVFLVDPARMVLQLHSASLYGIPAGIPEQNKGLSVDDPQFPFTVTDTLRALRYGKLSEERAIIPFYRALIDCWAAESQIVVPLVVRNEGIGEIWFNSQTANFFDNSDMQLVATAAGQLAGAAEQMALRNQTDEDLQRRVATLTALTRMGRELSNTFDLDKLLGIVYSEALQLSCANCGAVIFFNPRTPKDGIPAIQRVTGEEREAGLTSLELSVVQKNQPEWVEDFEAVGSTPPHSGMRSALVVPILSRQALVGLISLHGERQAQFDQEVVEIVQLVAVQAAPALGNATQYENLNRRSQLLKRELDTLTELLQISRMLRPSLPLDQSLVAISSAIREATPFQVNVISVYDSETGLLHRVCSSGLPADQWTDLQSRSQAWSSVQPLLKAEFRSGASYYVPADKIPVTPQDFYYLDVAQNVDPSNGDAWNPDDFLLMPLYDSNGNPLGLISVDAPADQRRPDRPTFEALELLGVQAGLMIENHQRVGSLEKRVGVLESEGARLQGSIAAAQENLPLLLHKDLNQVVELQSLNRRIERIRASLEIAAQANQQSDAMGILRTLCTGLLTRFAMQTALIGEKTSTGMHLAEVIGNVPAGVNLDALFGQRNPLRELLQESGDKEIEVLLVSNLESHSDWGNNPLVNGLDARSLIGILFSGGQGIRSAILLAGRRSLGAFSDEDRRVFEQLGRQVSTGLENLQLLTETRRRLGEVNLLLEFSLKLGRLKPVEILHGLLESVCGVLPNVQAGWVGLLDQKRACTVPQDAIGYPDNEAVLKIVFSMMSTTGLLGENPRLLLLRILRSGQPLRVGEVDFATQYHLSPNDLLNYRQATRGKLPVSCMILPLRLSDRVGGMVVLENFDTQNAFSSDDEALVYSFTQQASLALDNSRLYQASEMRAGQLQNLTRVSSLLNSSLKQEELTDSLLSLLHIVIPYDSATLWARRGNTLTVLSANGYEDDQSQLGLSAAVEDSALFLEMIRTGEPIAIGDVRSDVRFSSLVEPDNLSWLGLPLIVNGEVIGLIAMDKREADFFNADYIQTGSTFASQSAASLENSRLFEESVHRAAELDQRSQRLAMLNQLSEELGASLDSNFILRLTGQRLLNALNADGIACVMVGPGDKFILELEEPKQLGKLPIALLDSPLFEHLKESHGIFSTAAVENERDLGSQLKGYLIPRKIASLLVVPLITGSKVHGWMLMQKTASYRFSVSEIELARTVCNQAAIAIQNAQLFDETRSLTEFLEKRVEERTGELRREHKNSQTLLRVISELTTSLDMGLVLNRALAVINESLGSQESMTFLLHGTRKPFQAGEMLVSEAENQDQTAPLEHAITDWVAHNRKYLLVDNIANDERLAVTAGAAPAYRSVLAVPLVMGENVLGALLLLHREERFFKPNQVSLAEATARQIAIALNNAELFDLIRDQSEHLGNMLREQQIESSRSRAILEAVADGVVVTDEHGLITLVNVSAERILDLKSGEAIGQAIERFSGLFGRSGSAWMRTIHDWSNKPRSYKGETFGDQFDLDNGNVIAVHLAPVFWRSQFLGTVSIFRDITHEVQVDRMKSEFVANVSHELRTPMTSIKGYVEIMLMGAAGEMSAQQRHFLEIVQNNTERLSILVNDLLDLSRIESGRVKLNRQELNLRKIITAVVMEMKRRSAEENKPMTFEVEIPDDLPPVQGDEERVSQVVTNLLSNSYFYSHENSQVWVRIHPEKDEIQVDVQDNGIGIRLEDQHRVFERFYRGDDPLVLKTAGTGLGLAVSKTLVGMHNGRLWFKSNGIRGQGSTFSFTLPICQIGMEDEAQ